jgi:arylsulfatase A-like enzyme
VGTYAPHTIPSAYRATFPDRHKGTFPNLKAPRKKSFNEKNVSDKPRWVRRTPRLDKRDTRRMNRLFRTQAISMLAVDEMIGTLREALEEKGMADNTYIVFTSDNGHRYGEHRLFDPPKRLAYEEDIRVPLYVDGPGVAAGKRSEIALNNDLAPTFAELAGTEMLRADGRSLVPLLRGNEVPWRVRFGVEGASHSAIRRPAYKGVRTKNYLYVKWGSGERELYDMRRDPYQLQGKDLLSRKTLARTLQRNLEALWSCKGKTCEAAEN